MKVRAILAFVLDRPGVLNKIAMLIRRRNFEVIHRQNQALFILQISGTTKHIDNFLSDVGNENIVEIARSGVTAMEK